MTLSSNQTRTIGVVIPALNEEENLLRVLNVVCAVDWVEQIVVVDDGSTDGTLNIIKQLVACDERLLAIHMSENHGKAAALLTGVQA